MFGRIALVLISGGTLALASAYAPSVAKGSSSQQLSELSAGEPTSRQYGRGTALGNGVVRSYVTLDNAGMVEEVGIALSESALEGLPGSVTGHHGGHEMPNALLLDLPAEHTAPFQFIELNWNPSGHEPEGVYLGVPHFDFHFWTVSRAEREAIVPTDPTFAAKANHVPESGTVPQFAVPLAPPNAPLAAIAVPMMGVHWSDVRSPELQGLMGHPEAYRPFTTTFIHGSWDGKWIFWEPMITRAYILAKKEARDPAERDEVIKLPTPEHYQVAGSYPRAYRITWDETAREYRIALTQLTQR